MEDHSAHTAIKPTTQNERALKISGWLTGIYFLIEFGIGITRVQSLLRRTPSIPSPQSGACYLRL